MAKRERKLKAIRESGYLTNPIEKLGRSHLKSSQTGPMASSDSAENSFELGFMPKPELEQLFQFFKKYLPLAKSQLATKAVETETVNNPANACKSESFKDPAEKFNTEPLTWPIIELEMNPQQSFCDKPTEDVVERLVKSNNIFNQESTDSVDISRKGASFDNSEANPQESQGPLSTTSDFIEIRNVPSDKLNSIPNGLGNSSTEGMPNAEEKLQINSDTNEENESRFLFADSNGFVDFNEEPIDRLKAVSADLFKMCWVDLSSLESQTATIADPVNRSKSDQSSDLVIESGPNLITSFTNEPESTQIGGTNDKLESNNECNSERQPPAPPTPKYTKCFLRLVRVLQPELYEFIGDSRDVRQITGTGPNPLVKSVRPLRHTQQEPQVRHCISSQHHCTPAVGSSLGIHSHPATVLSKSTQRPGCSVRCTARNPTASISISYANRRHCGKTATAKNRN